MKYRRQRVDLRSFLGSEVPLHQLPTPLRRRVRSALSAGAPLRPVVREVVSALLAAGTFRRAGVLRDGAEKIPVYALDGSPRVYDLRELLDADEPQEAAVAETLPRAPVTVDPPRPLNNGSSRASFDALRRTLRRDWVSHGLEASLDTVLAEMSSQLDDPSLRLWLWPERLQLALGSGSRWELLNEGEKRADDLDSQLGGVGGHEAEAAGRRWAPVRIEGELVGALGSGSLGTDVLRPDAVDTLEELLQAFQRSQDRVYSDALTGLRNRAFFDQQFGVELERASRLDQPLALLFADLDHFKRINDQHGHDSGDAVLRHVARLMVGHLRRIDYVFRWGGEEFALILPGTARDQALYTADRLRAVIESTPVVLASGQTLRVTMSIGAAMAPEHARGGEKELLRLADEALYRAKAEGRNKVCMAKDPR